MKQFKTFETSLDDFNTHPDSFMAESPYSQHNCNVCQRKLEDVADLALDEDNEAYRVAWAVQDNKKDYNSIYFDGSSIPKLTCSEACVNMFILQNC